MALMTPIALQKDAFDAEQPQEFSFTVTGGNQVVKNELTIRDNDTDEVVYHKIVETYKFSQTVPANTLSNGSYYNYFFNTYDVKGSVSNDSNVVQFYCYTTPTLQITNIPSNRIIQSASFRFIAEYFQEQEELLDTAIFYLYNGNGVLIANSGNVYSNEENILEWNYEGLIDKEEYSVVVSGVTVNGTQFQSEQVKFQIQYQYEEYDFDASAENKCEDGYVEVKSNISVIGGNSNRPLIYSDNGVVLEYKWYDTPYVEWENFSLNSQKFTLYEWWKPVYHGEVLRLSNELDRMTIKPTTSSTSLTLSLERTRVNGEIKDYLLLEGYYDWNLYLYHKSNYVDPLNSTAELMTYLRIDGKNVDLRLVVLNQETTDLQILGSSDVFENGVPKNPLPIGSNVEFNRLTDIYDNVNTPYKAPTSNYNKTEDSYEISICSIQNSIVKHLTMYNEVTSEYTENIPTQWTSHTVFDCDFNGNVSAGKYKWDLIDVDQIKIKRRRADELDWITIYSQDVKVESDLHFTFRDYFVPSGYNFEWAIVPCLNGDESNYFTATATTYYRALFVSDNTKTMKLIGGVAYEGNTITQQIGMLQPYQSVYPVIISNPYVKYESLGVSGILLYYKDKEAIMDRNKMAELREEWINFLCNGNPKVVKDANGKIILGKVTTTPTFSYASNWGNGLMSIAFAITEQGKYNNQNDLIRNRIIKEVN